MRSSGAHPQCARRIAATCTAVRAGTSFFNATARSSTSAGVRGDTRRGLGTRASKPPRRQSRIHRSIVARDDAHRLPERALMLTRGKVADQPAALPGGQLRVGGLADQRVPEQPDRAGPFGPDLLLLVMADGHAHLLALAVGNGHESRDLLINRPRPRAGSC